MGFYVSISITQVKADGHGCRKIYANNYPVAHKFFLKGKFLMAGRVKWFSVDSISETPRNQLDIHSFVDQFRCAF